MIQHIPCLTQGKELEALKARVIQMNTGVDNFVIDEMRNHHKCYNYHTGRRRTEYTSKGNSYSQEILVQPDGFQLPVEIIEPEVRSRRAVLYIHGAAFHRRSNDINLKTADRLCSRTGQMVVVPDYRVGEEYTYGQMVSDVLNTYQWLTEQLCYAESDITILADSSGCITAMQAMRQMVDNGTCLPSKLVMWSPQYDEKFGEERLNEGKAVDVALQTNDLFGKGFRQYRDTMCAGMELETVIPCYGDYSHWSNVEVLIQSGGSEMLTKDAYALDKMLSQYCEVTTEVYECMYHNFATYYSMCEMARVCWDRATAFILHEDMSQYCDAIKPLRLA